VGGVNTRGRIAFFSEYAFPVLVPIGMPFAGGAEMQIAKFARGLQAQGFDVTVVTGDFGQPPEMRMDGIRILKTFMREHGIPGLRFFHPRLTRTVGALRKAHAEVYYVNGSGMAAGMASDVARSLGAAFINHCASDYDVTPDGLKTHLGLRDRVWYQRAIRRADLVLAQNAWQREHFRSEFGVESEILPNIAVLPERSVEPAAHRTVVWLGTYKEIKRPDWFIQLAADIPTAPFVMAGVVPPLPLSTEHWERAVAASQGLPNLRVLGFRTPAEVDELYREAALLVHTSPVEGFPNVLLEAWSHGLPSVSCVDPDGVVTREAIGRVATDYDGLLRAVTACLSDPSERAAAGRRAREYVRRRHAPELVMNQLAAVLDRVVSAVRARRGA
jgi:glycosyltransferase involved in cell wall biosynthesis